MYIPMAENKKKKKMPYRAAALLADALSGSTLVQHTTIIVRRLLWVAHLIARHRSGAVPVFGLQFEKKKNFNFAPSVQRNRRQVRCANSNYFKTTSVNKRIRKISFCVYTVYFVVKYCCWSRTQKPASCKSWLPNSLSSPFLLHLFSKSRLSWKMVAVLWEYA